MKKAQGLSIQTIVLAVLALFVLVVIILVFTGIISVPAEFFQQQLTCESRGGQCPLTKEDCRASGGVFNTLACGSGEKYSENQGCCISQT